LGRVGVAVKVAVAVLATVDVACLAGVRPDFGGWE
jgi:hypothetical protein